MIPKRYILQEEVATDEINNEVTSDTVKYLIDDKPLFEEDKRINPSLISSGELIQQTNDVNRKGLLPSISSIESNSAINYLPLTKFLSSATMKNLNTGSTLRKIQKQLIQRG